MPLASLISVSVLVEFDANVPLAPDAEAVKVTNAPLTGDPPIVTVATRSDANFVLTIALCGVPPVAAINSAGGLKFELLQLVKKTKTRKMSPIVAVKVWRFIAPPRSRPYSGWHADVPAATEGPHARCGGYRLH